MPQLTLRYFAIFREQAGRDSQEFHASAENASDLYDEIQALHRFTLPKGSVRVAINDEFAAMHSSLRDGDVVAFIAPVAGG